MEKIATQYAVRLFEAKTLDDLRHVANEIKAYIDQNPDFKRDWRTWLLDIHQSRKDTLQAPDWRGNLNSEGLKWAKKEKLI